MWQQANYQNGTLAYPSNHDGLKSLHVFTIKQTNIMYLIILSAINFVLTIIKLIFRFLNKKYIEYNYIRSKLIVSITHYIVQFNQYHRALEVACRNFTLVDFLWRSLKNIFFVITHFSAKKKIWMFPSPLEIHFQISDWVACRQKTLCRCMCPKSIRKYLLNW